MSHVLDHMAHAALRGFVYRVMWHSPALVALVIFVIAAAYLTRRYP